MDAEIVSGVAWASSKLVCDQPVMCVAEHYSKMLRESSSYNLGFCDVYGNSLFLAGHRLRLLLAYASLAILRQVLAID